MKNIYRIAAGILLLSILFQTEVFGGNDKRRGTAGAGELLINPWTRSAGWGGVNTANGKGIDALFTNVAGLAFTTGTEVAYSYSNWLQGSGIGINAAAVAQRLGSGVLSLSFMSMSYGDEDRVSAESPERDYNGTFSPTAMNIGVSYSYSFSNSIYGGALVKVITEGTDNVTAAGIAIDAGIQYVTGENNEIKFGVALKNIGPPMSFSGAGLSFNVVNEINGSNNSVESISSNFELPTILNIGASYDFLFTKINQRLTIAGNFNSYAFGRDKYIIGAEYAFLSMFQVRAGYAFEEDIFSSEDRTNFVTGLSAGVSFETPLAKRKPSEENKIIPTIKLEYSYRTTDPMGGIHSVGIGMGF